MTVGGVLSARTVRLCWVFSRVAVLVLMFGPEVRVVGDVGYFLLSLRHLDEIGLGETMREYPVPAIAVVVLPWLVAGWLHSLELYGFLFIACALALDAAFAVVLWRRAGPSRGTAVVFWLVAVPAMGGLSFVRFDMVPGVLVGLVILLAATWPRATALLVAVATSIKLWPVLMVPLLLAGSRRRLQGAAIFIGVGVASVVITVLASSWSRVWSPLTYQADRGLQIESVSATPAMLGYVVDPDRYRIFYSSFKAYEITGPGVATALRASSALSIVLLLGLSLLWLRAARSGRLMSTDALVWASLASVLGFMCVNKVLSPQYLLWLLPMTAAGLTVVSTTFRSLARWGIGLLVATALSHLIFPWLYHPIAEHGPGTTTAVTVLAVRNVILVVLLGFASLMAVRCQGVELADGEVEKTSGEFAGARD